MDEYNKHYIRLDENNNIIRGFSNVFEEPQEGDICINEQGGRHFELNGVINPRLINESGIFLFRYENGKVIAKTPDELLPALDQMRQEKLAVVGRMCQNTIYAGVEVGGRHYSLSEHDQIELMGQSDAIKQGVVSVPYHADGELCRLYTAEEFSEIATAATAHIFYHRTYCNHLNAWIRRSTTVDEVSGIAYTGNIADLPSDLAANIQGLLTAVM